MKMLRSMGLSSLRGTTPFYLLIIGLMAIYCIYITKQNPVTLPFSFRFNEPLEAKFVSNSLIKKIKNQDEERANSLVKLTDVEKITSQNNDKLPLTSAFGTNLTDPNWANTICLDKVDKKCGAKLKNLETRLRSAPSYKTMACIIQKNMSTVLQAIMCFLFNEEKFREANRVLSRECHDVRFCVGKNEYNGAGEANQMLKKIHTEIDSWLYLAIVRDPIDRFLSGYVDKCVRKPHTPKGYCNGCNGNMTCFILTEYNKIIKSSYGGSVSRTFEDRHFFPQTWRCNFNTEMEHYKLVKYSSLPEYEGKFLNDLLHVLEQQGVSKNSSDFIREQLNGGRTVHSTIASDARTFYEKRLRSSPFLMEHVIRMFYWDYKLLGFELPTF